MTNNTGIQPITRPSKGRPVATTYESERTREEARKRRLRQRDARQKTKQRTA